MIEKLLWAQLIKTSKDAWFILRDINLVKRDISCNILPQGCATSSNCKKKTTFSNYFFVFLCTFLYNTFYKYHIKRKTQRITISRISKMKSYSFYPFSFFAEMQGVYTSRKSVDILFHHFQQSRVIFIFSNLNCR